MLSVLEFLVDRSTFALITMSAVAMIVGLPKKKARYRTLLAIGCAFSVGAVIEWYLHLVVAQMYFRDEAHWYFFPLVAFFVILAAACAWELATLLLFSRLKKRDEKG